MKSKSKRINQHLHKHNNHEIWIEKSKKSVRREKNLKLRRIRRLWHVEVEGVSEKEKESVERETK